MTLAQHKKLAVHQILTGEVVITNPGQEEESVVPEEIRLLYGGTY